MKHHEPLIAMRLKGQKPSIVFLDVDCADEETPFWRHRDPGSAHVAIEPADAIHRLDMRFLLGCTVIVQGLDDERNREAFNAAVTADAERVAAVVGDKVLFHDVRAHGRSAA